MAPEVHCHHRLHQCLAPRLDQKAQLLDRLVLKAQPVQLEQVARPALPEVVANQV
jgi:hypothetical protein